MCVSPPPRSEFRVAFSVCFELYLIGARQKAFKGLIKSPHQGLASLSPGPHATVCVLTCLCAATSHSAASSVPIVEASQPVGSRRSWAREGDTQADGFPARVVVFSRFGNADKEECRRARDAFSAETFVVGADELVPR